jgi:hypothetical protein
MYLAIALLTFLVSAIVCHTLAKSRGGNPILWGALGFTFGPLAIPFVFLSGRKHS